MATDSERLFPGKFIISSALEALETKTAMSMELSVRYLQRAGIAGVLIAIFYGAYFSVIATFSAISVGGTPLTGVGKLMGALVFGWALVFIYFTKSELLTSNMMVAAIGVYYRRVRWTRALRMLALCLLMSVFIFAFLGLEHSVANTILFTIVGLKSGIDAGLAAANVAIALVGNFIGGGVLIGLYYAYVNDDTRYRK
jgi:formate/nitrite transporter FocA (FNT family)